MKILITVQDDHVAPRFDQTTEVIIVEYDGEPSDNLEPVSKRAKAADAPSDEPTDPLV